MNKAFFLPLIAALALAAGACQKQQTEAERSAEVERQVQQRLDAERQADDQQQLADRQAELDARERSLAQKENRPVATAAPIATAPPATRTTERTADRTTTTTRERDDEETGSYSTFYRRLEPYGNWMETSDYGYVFQPRQATQSRDWRPYTHGHWVYTDAGWTWISDEQFGWATYHYGRWTRLRSVGWVWVPGEQWAPAWVSWRKGNDYVGWAPLPPEARFERGTGIRNWADNYYDIGPDQYAFVPVNQFGAKVSASVVVPTERNVTIINQTTNVTNITYNNSVIVDRGPSYDDLRAQSSQPIERFRLERTQSFTDERPVFRGEVVALPTIDFRPAERAARPSRVVRNIAQPVVERGWTGIKDTQAVQKARAKMQSESTPPPNLPSKEFVRPETNTVIPPRPGVTNVGSPAASIAPASTPVATPPRPVAADPTPPQPAENIYSPKAADRNRREEKQKQRQQEQEQRRNERQQKMQERRGQRPNETPAPTATVTPPPAATVAPSATHSVAPTAAATPKATATPKVTATPQASAAPEATATSEAQATPERERGKKLDQAERRAQRQQQMEERRARKAGPAEATPAATAAEAAASPAAAASIAPATDASVTPTENARKTDAEKRQEKKDRRKARRGGATSDSSPEPDASASPEAQQP